jgi:predicted Zn-ribbon and HTH transcriptional regulator
MINISLSQLILLCMIPGMLTILAWWLRTVIVERRQDRMLRSSSLRCRICGYSYQPTTPPDSGTASHCPSCQSANLHEPERII